MNKIKIGIIGYGNLGKGIDLNIGKFDDMELVGIFTRRNPNELDTKTQVYSYSDILNFKDKIDVMILCGASHNDLPYQTIEVAKHFNTVDSYDNHQNIPTYFKSVDDVSRESKKTSFISIGWDPGLFSLNRLIFESILPSNSPHTFWGKGVSQGHSQVVRSVDGVKYGIQYTAPIEETMSKIKCGSTEEFSPAQRHKRICYIVSTDTSLNSKIEREIKSIPGYFKEYDTEVNFITEEEFALNHKSMPHGGSVLHCANTSEDIYQTMEFKLNLDNNPEFTSSVLLAFARANFKLSREGKVGAYTIFDIPMGYLSPKSDKDLRKNLL